MSDLVSREYMRSLGATCIASRSKDGTLFPIVAIDELPPADLTREMPSNTLGALDCIDRHKAINIRFSEGFDHDGILYVPWKDVKAHLKELPSVKPEFQEWQKIILSKLMVIRCKDCKYAYMTGDGLVKHCDIWFPNEKLYQDGDYYCADAELRGDSDD